MSEQSPSTPPAAAEPPPAALVWNFGGWFGSVFGCTFWMFALSLFAITQDWITGAVGLALFALCWVYGVSAWRARETLTMHRAVQRFLWLNGGAALALFLAFDLRDVARDLPDRFGDMRDLPYAILLIYPAMSLGFWFRR